MSDAFAAVRGQGRGELLSAVYFTDRGIEELAEAPR